MIIDPAQASSADVYKVMIRSIVPRPIAWVSTISSEGVANLAPFSFFTGVSTRPPTVCFVPGRRPQSGQRKDTLQNVEETGEFVVNIVPAALAAPMNATAVDYPPDVDEFAEAGVTATPSRIVRAPRVAESPVSFECRRYDVVHVGVDGPGGSAIVIGEIVMIHVSDDVLSDGKIDVRLLDPLARLGGLEYARLGEPFEMKRD